MTILTALFLILALIIPLSAKTTVLAQSNPPIPLVIFPSSGSQVYNKVQNFTAKYRDNDADLAYVYLLIGDHPESGVLLNYNIKYNVFAINDLSGSWIPVSLPPNPTNVSNGYGVLRGANCKSVVSDANRKIAVTWSMKFRLVYRGTYPLFIMAEDSLGHRSAWKPVGTWTVL